MEPQETIKFANDLIEEIPILMNSKMEKLSHKDGFIVAGFVNTKLTCAIIKHIVGKDRDIWELLNTHVRSVKIGLGIREN